MAAVFPIAEEYLQRRQKNTAVVIMMLSEWVAPLCGGFGETPDPRGTAEKDDRSKEESTSIETSYRDCSDCESMIVTRMLIKEGIVPEHQPYVKCNFLFVNSGPRCLLCVEV
jgi:hypothetical protein